MREACGMSQQDVACEADVRIMTVKRWENPAIDGCMPPDDVWMWLLQAKAALMEDARDAADRIVAGCGSGDAVSLTYYRTQDQFEDGGTGIDEPVGYANARTRAIGDLLEKAEVPYTYRYPSQ